jgi:hypothetical protein
VPSLRAGVAPDAFPSDRLLVVLPAGTFPAGAQPGLLLRDGEIATTDNHALNVGLRMSW